MAFPADAATLLGRNKSNTQYKNDLNLESKLQSTWHMHSTKHSDLDAAVVDRKTNLRAIKNKIDVMGDLSWGRRYDIDGVPVTEPFWEPTLNKMVYPDQSGRVQTLNGDIIAEIEKAHDEREKHVDDLVKKCLIDDELTSTILGFPKDRWLNDIAKDGKDGGYTMSDEMKKLNCQIEYLKSLPTGSKEQTMGVSKLRFVIDKRLEMINIKNLRRGMDENHKNNDRLGQDDAANMVAPKTVA